MNQNYKNCISILFCVCISLFFVTDLWSLDLSRKKKNAERKLYIPITKKDRCVVCGMFVHPYQKWITQIQFKDGSYRSFDGMKCMCRFVNNPGKYESSKKKQDIQLILVRDYYTLKFIRHDKAFYVVGSDVLGPMGHELIPFDSKRNADIFSADHNGLKILQFNQINAELLDKLDKAKKTIHLE
ncbi:MAG: nitrous oxide reductase accessory protein NosL [Desulfobacteraceae bacterium]|nr:nitrous oxide reductase accessory protein NosL [Desulfobacteraceae bacterium]